jgi:hypothetical protein
VQELAGVYAQNFMRPRLLVSLLVLLLSGANAAAASMCADYCTSSPAAETAPMNMRHHIHTGHHGLHCAECPPKSGNSLSQKTDCKTLVEMQAIRKGSFSLDVPTGVAHVGVLTPAASHDLVSACEGEGSLLRNASSPISSSSPVSVPLRI